MHYEEKAVLYGFWIFLYLRYCIIQYLPYIYENHIFDFHLADTIGNLVAVPSLSLLLLAMRKYESLSKAILYSIFVFTLYEIIPFGTFDFYDLIATYISGLLTYLIFLLFKRVNKR